MHLCRPKGCKTAKCQSLRSKKMELLVCNRVQIYSTKCSLDLKNNWFFQISKFKTWQFCSPLRAYTLDTVISSTTWLRFDPRLVEDRQPGYCSHYRVSRTPLTYNSLPIKMLLRDHILFLKYLRFDLFLENFTFQAIVGWILD